MDEILEIITKNYMKNRGWEFVTEPELCVPFGMSKGTWGIKLTFKKDGQSMELPEAMELVQIKLADILTDLITVREKE